MTIIVTQITKYGIIHASDSLLTYPTQVAGVGAKVFRIRTLNAGLSLSGVYQVNNIPMDKWMRMFIQNRSNSRDLSLGGFAQELQDELQKKMLPSEKKIGNLIHIAGYVETNGNAHPELWFVRNIHGIRNDGEYTQGSSKFEVSEDFWTRDWKTQHLQQKFSQNQYQIYANGFAAGRMGFFLQQRLLDQFLQEIWKRPEWKFRPPLTLKESESFLRLGIQFVTALFSSSDYKPPAIGGKIQIIPIPAPPNSLV